MRTSKKILSFFLAVVMVVTTCSVGFTAFAKNSNDNPLWNTSSVNASSAYKTVNGLADELPSLLMGIDAISKVVYNKGAISLGTTSDKLTKDQKESIKENTTLPEMLQALQPTLINAVGKMAVSTSQSEFVTDIIGESSSNVSNYDYLNNFSDDINFFQLAGMCHKLIYDGVSNISANKETKKALEDILYGAGDRNLDGKAIKKITVDSTGQHKHYVNIKYNTKGLWYLTTLVDSNTSTNFDISDAVDNILPAIAQQYDDQVADGKIKPVELSSITDMLDFNGDGGHVRIGETSMMASLSQLKSATYTLTEAQQKTVNEVCSYLNNYYKVFGIDLNASDVADCIYYAYSPQTDTFTNMFGGNLARTMPYIRLAVDGGADFKLSADSDFFNDQWNPKVTSPTGDPYTIESTGIKTFKTVDGLLSQIEPFFTKALGYDNLDTAVSEMLSRDSASTDASSISSVKDYITSLYIILSYASLVDDVNGGGRQNAPYAQYILKGALVDFKGLKLEDINQAVDKDMPAGFNFYWQDGDEFFLTDDELEQMYSILNLVATQDNNFPETINGYFADGSMKFNDTDGSKTFILPKNLRDTATIEYFATFLKMYSRKNNNSDAQQRNKVINLFAGNWISNRSNKTSDYIQNATLLDTENSDPNTGIYAYKHTGNTYSKADLNEWVKYSYMSTLTSYFCSKISTASDDLTYDNNSIKCSLDISKFINDYVKEHLDTTGVTLTDAQKQPVINNALAALCGNGGTQLTNIVLNSIISTYLDPSSTIGNIINGALDELASTKIDLVKATYNIWANLIESPVETIFNLLPLVVVLVNEVLEPIFFSAKSGETKQNNMLYNFTHDGLLYDLTADYGSYIGIDTLAWDLNEMLPLLMHWLKNDGSYDKMGGTYWNNGAEKNFKITKYTDLSGGLDKITTKNITTSTVISKPEYVTKYEKIVDSKGNEITSKVVTEKKTKTEVDENGTAKTVEYTEDVTYYTYNGVTSNDISVALAKAPTNAKFTVYSKYEAKVPYITGIYIADKALRDAKLSGLDKVLKKAFTDDKGVLSDTNAQLATGLAEVINELAGLFTTAVDTYVNTPSLRNQVKGKDNNGNIANSGLNNLMVAIPQLFDIMEDLGADKYGVSKNAWTYCYDGKFKTEEITVSGKTYTAVSNTKVTEFKSYAQNPDSTKIFDTFVGIFVEDWLDAILGLVNNVIDSDNSAFAKNLPLITGVLQSIGGFGETSALTDLFNSIFQITRESKYSFTFEKQASGFVGLDKNNAYFLITNVSKLVDVIQSLVKSFKKTDNTNNNTNNNTTTAPTQAVQTSNSSVDISAYKSKDVKSVDSTIEKLDKALSSLLADSRINGYSINKTNNIIVGVISLLSNYIGANSANAVIDLLNTYLYYLNGEDSRSADSNGNVNPKDIYTNEGLTTVVVRTYALIESLVANLTDKYAYSYTGANNVSAKYNLISEAVNGLISPDSLAVRIKDTDIKNASGKLKKLASWSDAVNDNGTLNVSINWGVSAGNRDEFMNGLSTSLRLLTSIIGVLLIDTGIYENALYPVLNTIAVKTGITVDTPEKFADKSNPYRDEVFVGIVNPIVALLDKFFEKPVTTLLNLVSAIGVILDDTTAPTLASTIANAVKPISNEVNGLAKILRISNGTLGATSPTLASFLENIATKTFGKLVTVNDKQEIGIEVKGYLLSGNNIIPIINTLLAKTGIKLNNINWNALGKTASPAQTLLYVLDYVIEFVKTNNNLTTIIQLIMGNNKISKGIQKLIKYIETGKLDAMGLLKVIGKLLDFTQSPTEVYWTYKNYKGTSLNFKYPDGITAYDANNAVSQLDTAVDAVMALLANFGVVNASNLKSIVSGLAFTNANLTSLAKALYGALDTKKISPYLNMVGIAVSPKGVANLLVDKSYGKTYTSAANTLKKAKSWKKVKTINWGFKDGSAKAEQGFVNALAAILRPVNSVLAVFLNEGKIDLSNINIKKASTSFDIKDSNGKVTSKVALTYMLKKGVLTLTLKDDMNPDSKLSTIKLDLNALNVGVNGINGYEGAIVPLLDVLQVSNSKIKTFKQYQKDYKKAKDNVILDVLNPLMSFVDTLLDKPFDTLTSVLPNLAYFIDNNGIGQLLDNLLAPVTNILKTAKSAGVDVDKILTMVLGKDLGKVVTNALKVKGVKLNIKLANLKSCNIQDIVVPLLNSLLKKTGIKLPEFKWSTIASHGKVVTSKSMVKNAEGKFTNKEVIADKGEVLVAVLRYIADTLVKNSKSIKSLITSIKAIKSNDMLKSIISTVFTTIGLADKDDIVRAVFYFLTGEPTNAFWDYTAYKTGSYDFSYPESVDVDFLKNLPPMLDGLVGGLVDGGLTKLIGGLIFKDDIINSLLTGLYGAVEGVKVGDGSLVSLLAQTNIDFSTSNVAKLLTDESYGQTYAANASVIAKAGSWSKVNTASLKWGVKDADTFFHALVAVLRPIYGVLDVLLNDASLGIFDIVRIPGSNGYTSSIVPLMEAFSMYNIKTQYQYREDINEAYDNILLDIINPLWDKVEDILNAPLETLFAMLPNLALFIGNDGLCQILDNLLTPISALVDAIKPIVDLNTLLPALLKALKVDLNSILGKIGVTNFSLDIYDLNATLKPLLGGDAIIPLVNNILGLIKIKGAPLGIKLNDVDWLKLASHGKVITDTSQAATYGARIYVEGDSSETLIAVLGYLIETVNTGDNFKNISDLITGLVGGNETVSGVVNQVLPVLKGDTDTVIASLVDLLQTMA